MATKIVPPPLPGRARTPGTTVTPVPSSGLPAAGAPTATAAGTATPTAKLMAVPAASVAPFGAPAALPSAEEAEGILTAALGGEVDPDPAWRAAADRVLQALCGAERAALSPGPLPSDPDRALLRATAGLRLRLDVAVALVPTRPDLHATVFPALLAEVDALLVRVKAAASEAPSDAAEALEAVRLALVDGGVTLAGAMARALPAAPAVAAVPTSSPARSAPRVLSNVTAAEAAAASRGGKGVWVALVLAVVVAAGYHGWQFATRKPPAALPALAGAPAHTFVIRQGASVVLNLEPGATVDAGELERFAMQERAKGNEVRAIGNGMWIVAPAAWEGTKP
jgi:hypothetical protein